MTSHEKDIQAQVFAMTVEETAERARRERMGLDQFDHSSVTSREEQIPREHNRRVGKRDG